MLEDLFRDLRISARSLRKQAGFTAVAILTIALGIGAATTIFGLVDGILLKPLAYPESGRLVAVWPDQWYSGRLFEQLEREAASYAALAAWGPRSFTEMADEGALRLYGSRTTGDFLRVLGTEPSAGRAFGSVDDDPGSEGGVVLSHGFWLNRFGGDPSAVGQRLRLVGADVPEGELPILGVMPDGFDFGPGYFSELREPADFAITVPFDRDHVRYRSAEYKVIGRLEDGVTVEQAAEELRILANAWREQFGLPDTFGDDARVIPLKEFMTGSMRPTLLLLFGAVGLILLIAAVNVANLLLARALGRHREVAVRLAIGATGRRVVRQLLVESTLIGALGSAVGMLVALAGVAAVRALLPSTTPRIDAVGVDARALAFCAALALLTGWAVGLLPALRSSRADVRSAIGGESRGSTGGRRRRRLQAGLLTAEIGLAVLLLASAGLLTKSFWRLSRLDPGFRAEGLAKLYVRPTADRVPTLEDHEQYFRLVDERLEALPGVVSAATVSQAPVTGDGGVVGYYPAERPPQEGEEPPRVRWRAISPDYFEVATIPILQGRGFTRSDVDGSEPVAILSRQAADELFPGAEAVGRRVITGFESGRAAIVVGVAGDVRILGPAEPSLPMVYRPYAQIRSVFENFGFIGREMVVRTGAGSAGLAESIRRALREVDRNALVTGFEPIPTAIAATLSGRRTTLILLGSFAIGAIALGGVGIYGVTGYLVRERRREMGVRLAVGASTRRVIGEVLAGVLKVALLGAALGVIASVSLAGVLRHFLVEIAAIDAGVLGMAVLVALGVALLAGLIPARAAGRTDPLEILVADA